MGYGVAMSHSNQSWSGWKENQFSFYLIWIQFTPFDLAHELMKLNLFNSLRKQRKSNWEWMNELLAPLAQPFDLWMKALLEWIKKMGYEAAASLHCFHSWNWLMWIDEFISINGMG